MWNAGLEEAQAGIKTAGRNISKLRYADDTTPMVKCRKKHCLLMRVNEESEKDGLKLNIQKMKIMASGPITSWQIDGGKKWKQWQIFIFLSSKITVDSDCSQKIKRCLFRGRTAMTNLDRDIILPTKVHIVKAMVFPVVMYRCESWTIKKAEHWRTDAFELRC